MKMAKVTIVIVMMKGLISHKMLDIRDNGKSIWEARVDMGDSVSGEVLSIIIYLQIQCISEFDDMTINLCLYLCVCLRVCLLRFVMEVPALMQTCT